MKLVLWILAALSIFGILFCSGIFFYFHANYQKYFSQSEEAEKFAKSQFVQLANGPKKLIDPRGDTYGPCKAVDSITLTAAQVIRSKNIEGNFYQYKIESNCGGKPTTFYETIRFSLYKWSVLKLSSGPSLDDLNLHSLDLQSSAPSAVHSP